MTAVELVLLFGPPFTGKTLYYYKHYSQSHSRLSAQEIFEKEGCKNLRIVILKAVELLSKGQNIVIDDENWYSETRQSYCRLVKQKIPNCILTVVQFLPETSFGYQQCLWAREWVLVYWTLLDKGQNRALVFSDSDERLDCWFSRRRVIPSNLNPPELPTVTEGVSVVTVKPELTCNTPYKFSLAGFFVQWQSLLVASDSGDVTYKPGTADVLNKWFNMNPSGRIIIIGPKLTHEKEIFDERTKLSLLLLASQVSSPIYFTFIDTKHQPDQFSKLPQPGVIAFLQKLHTIDLKHKGTMYVYQSAEHYKAASSVGIRAVKAEKLFAHTHMIAAIYCRETAQTLPFLKQFQQVNCPFNDARNEKDDAVVSEALIPFLSRARKSSPPLVWKYCYGKINGICFKDKLILERYQTQYALAAQPPGNTSPKRETNQNESSVQPDNLSSAVSASLKNIDLRLIAETPGRYQGGFICKEKIFNLNVEVLECQLKITCNCIGSTALTYDVEAIINDGSGLVKAHCSCPDPAGKNGRCKHVIGLLLNYTEDPLPSPLNQKGNESSCSHRSESKRSLPSWMTVVNPKNQKGNESSCSHRSESNRSLPSWMTVVNPKSRERRKSSSSLQGTSKTSDKKSTPKRSVKTFYCMSQEELVETAKELLQKNKESATRDSQQPPPLSEPEKCDHLGKVMPQKRRTVEKEEYNADVLEELLFGGNKDQRKPHKKICTQTLSSLAEETPSDKLPSSSKGNDDLASIIIPDSLVPETVSVIPETVSLNTVEPGSECSPRDGSNLRHQTTPKLQGKEESFQDFLDDIM